MALRARACYRIKWFLDVLLALSFQSFIAAGSDTDIDRMVGNTTTDLEEAGRDMKDQGSNGGETIPDEIGTLKTWILRQMEHQKAMEMTIQQQRQEIDRMTANRETRWSMTQPDAKTRGQRDGRKEANHTEILEPLILDGGSSLRVMTRKSKTQGRTETTVEGQRSEWQEDSRIVSMLLDAQKKQWEQREQGRIARCKPPWGELRGKTHRRR